MLALVDNLLNRITMYRLVLYYLIVLLAVAMLFGALHILPYDPGAIVFSVFVLLLVSLATNGLFARTFGAQANVESVYITALILALIITPVSVYNLGGVPFLIWAAIWAMASKYILAIRRKHIFNPSAFAVALTALTIGQSASWWVGGNIPLLPFVLVGGLLVARKIQRFDLVLSFLAAALASILVTSASYDPLSTLQKALIHAPLFFFAFVMITEPLTTPPTRPRRILYGAFVGALFAPAIHLGSFYSTPELALLVGNILSYILSPKTKYVLKLTRKDEVGTGIYDFAFAGTGHMRFRPGQYMEWTLGHEKRDSRGNRRYFTLASSPTEKDVHLGVRFYDPPSSFKRTMHAMRPGDEIVAGQLAGDFTLPRDQQKKLVFVAGGIGITPFRSMVKYLTDRGERRDITLLYSNRTPEEIAYQEVFDEAEAKIGLRTVYAITDLRASRADAGAGAGTSANAHTGTHVFHYGRIDRALIAAAIPDYRERMFYISGTNAMVAAFKKTLAELGVPRGQIKTDFFPGFA